ncbi:MAG TPA: hypothetical protein V6C81_27035 [Planktothrix sp.]|jgi:hypothetical protein
MNQPLPQVSEQEELEGSYTDPTGRVYRLTAAKEGTYSVTTDGICTRGNIGSKVTVESGGICQGMPGSRLFIKDGGFGIAEADCHMIVSFDGRGRGKCGSYITAEGGSEVEALDGCMVDVMAGATVNLRPGALYRIVGPAGPRVINILPAE